MEDLEIFGIPYLAKGSGIHIKKKKIEENLLRLKREQVKLLKN